MKTHATERRTALSGGALYRLYVVGVAAALGGNVLILVAAELGWLGSAGRVVVAVVAVLPLVVAAGMFWQLLRQDLDEMVQRIVLEGMAFALIVYVPISALFVNLKTAGGWVPRLDPPDLLLMPALLVAIGIFLAWRRLQ